MDSSRFTVNIYDVFANFLPGFIFLGGAAIPFLPGDTLSGFGTFGGTLLIFASFAVGGMMQALGSYTKHYQYRFPTRDFPSESANEWSLCLIEKRKMPFNRIMDEIANNQDDLTPPQSEFFSSCRNLFGFDSDSDNNDGDWMDWGDLFKICLTHLEITPYNRTLRIQAQHLATRGLYISFFIIFIYYIALSAIQVLPIYNLQQFDVISWQRLVIIGLFCVPISYIFYLRSVHFEKDVVNYMIAEVVASGSNITQNDDNQE